MLSRSIPTLLLCSSLGLSMAPSASAGLTGHIDILSKYVGRGITAPLESDGPAVQGGLDYTSADGWYAGYMFSTLSYSYAPISKPNAKSTEHDFIGGYNGKWGDFAYTLGVTGYYYDPGEDARALETKLGLTYNEFNVSVFTLLNDAALGNAGDTYWLGTYTKGLPKDFTFSGQLGFYSYCKQADNLNTSESAGFRHLSLILTHPIGTTGATWGLQYIIGGKDRMGIQQGNSVVGSLVFGF